MKHIELSEYKWQYLLSKMHEDYPLSVFAVRDKMRKVLGLTSRRHLVMHEDGYYNAVIHIDFYDELKRTFFILKYGEYL